MSESQEPQTQQQQPLSQEAGAGGNPTPPAQPPVQSQDPPAAPEPEQKPTEPKQGLLGGETDQPKVDDQVLGAPQEGYSTETMKAADAGVAAAFTEVAKELNLSQGSVDKIYTKVAPVMQQRAAAVMDAAEKEWTEASLRDSEFGGEAFAKNQVRMKQVFAKYASPELQKVLRESRLDCHPEFLRMVYRMGKDLSDDVLVTGNRGGARTGSSDPRSMFPNTDMNP